MTGVNASPGIPAPVDPPAVTPDRLADRLLSRRWLFGIAGAGLVAGAAGVLAVRRSASNDAAPDVTGTTSDGFLTSSTMHTVHLEVSAADIEAALTTYNDSGEKDWVTARVLVDGATYPNSGIRLKGNSSLRGVSADSDPVSLPWLVRLDENIDGQNHEGMTEFVIRSNSSETALNEAVALDLLNEAGLAAERAAYIRLSVNSGAEVVRLVVENPNEQWVARVFDGAGLLYKAEAGGDYSYRGEDPESYADIFDQETGDDDLSPLTSFLQFINESSDADFAAGLDKRLDTNAFLTYLAFQEVVGNFDDIDGPGNNSYLWWSAPDDQMTVVNWDLNLALGVGFGGNGAGGRGGMGGLPSGAPPSGRFPGGAPGYGGAGYRWPGGYGGYGETAGFGGGSNILVQRFNAMAGISEALSARQAELTASLIGSGVASAALERYADLLSADAGDLLDSATIASDRDAIVVALQ